MSNTTEAVKPTWPKCGGIGVVLDISPEYSTHDDDQALSVEHVTDDFILLAKLPEVR